MRTFALVSVLALAAGTAHAGNLAPPPMEPEVAPPAVVPAPVSDWTGPYAGLQLGWGSADTNIAGVDGNGLVGGGHVGYDFDFGSLVLGGEADFDFTDLSLNGGLVRLDNIGRLKLRGGIDAGPALIYGTGGAAYSGASIAGVNRSDWGWVVGAGMAYRVTDSFTLGGEVTYQKFSNYDATGVDVEATTLTARASWRF